MEKLSIPRFQGTARPEAVIAALDEHGVAVVEAAADEATMRGLDGELEPVLRRTPAGEGKFFGLKTRRMGRLLAKSPTSRKMALQGLVFPVVETILRRHCTRIQMNLTQAIRIEPGELPQILHKDDEFYPTPRQAGMELMINALWACTDFTGENGATRVVPGSHRRPIDRDTQEDVLVAAMKRGSVLLYFGSVLHGGGANRSTAPRTGVVFSYCLGWLRQAENQYLAYPPEVAKAFSPELRQLVGYAIHEPNLGWYEGQDPSVLFSDIRPEFLPARDNMSPEMAAHVERRYRKMAG